MNSKRVFANDKDINFNEYTKNKMGIEILKNIRSKKESPVLTRFYSYERFILLTKTYFKYWKKISPEILIPINIYNTITSFVCYQSLLSNIKDCNDCKYCKDILHLCNCNCKELKGILYPYGLYISNNIPNGINLHKRVTLDDWCLTCEEPVPLESIYEESEPESEFVVDLPSNCSACSSSKNQIHKSKQNTSNTHVFPSQNMFVFEQNNKHKNDYENTQRMNAYAVYPNIKNCEHKEKVKVDDESPSCKKMGLCKNTRPLFI